MNRQFHKDGLALWLTLGLWPNTSSSLELEAHTVLEMNAPEADQGVAVGPQHVFAVDNSVIAKYRKHDGKLVQRWDGSGDGLIQHLNSCYFKLGILWCANSNYPEIPMGSSIEQFDANSMQHIQSHSLGLTDQGSLVWFSEIQNGWLAGFAHYTTNGGLSYKGHDFSSLVRYDKDWRRVGGWLFPKPIIARMAPYSASGGAISPDGLLYVMGHDAPEMYVLGQPTMGPTLIHVATIKLEAEGQAFSFDPDDSLFIWVVDRRRGKLRRIRLPALSTMEHLINTVPFR